MRIDGDVVSTNSSAAWIGNPLEALRWLAVNARDLGQSLTAGRIILAGALGRTLPVTFDATVSATISGSEPSPPG